MASQPAELDSALESFRQQWISDIQTHNPQHPPQPPPNPGPSASSHLPLSPPASASIFGPLKQPPPAPAPAPADAPSDSESDAEPDGGDVANAAPVFDDAPEISSKAPASAAMADDDPRMTALEAYERAAEREATGQLGDSLKLYRKAYRVGGL
jgi:F-box protein 9